MLNDISPIANAMDMSRFASTGYSNILDSTQPRSRKLSINDNTESNNQEETAIDSGTKMDGLETNMNPYKLRYHREDMDQKI